MTYLFFNWKFVPLNPLPIYEPHEDKLSYKVHIHLFWILQCWLFCVGSYFVLKQVKFLRFMLKC